VVWLLVLCSLLWAELLLGYLLGLLLRLLAWQALESALGTLRTNRDVGTHRCACVYDCIAACCCVLVKWCQQIDQHSQKKIFLQSSMTTHNADRQP
jgi:hypothetical protein